MKNIKRLVALALVVVSVLAISVPALAGSATAGSLNVRSGPGSSYATVGGQIALGSTFNIMFQCTGTTVSGSTSKVWFYVEYINCKCGKSNCNAPSAGYIHSSFVSGTPSTSRPTNPTTAFGSTLIKLGAKGPEVYNIQLALYACGYLTWGDCDGLFGSNTYKQVKEFQLDHRLANDGIVGPLTMDWLWVEGQGTLKVNGVKCH